MKQISQELIQKKEKALKCSCDDHWRREISTGHSWVCRIHQAILAEWNESGLDPQHATMIGKPIH